MRNINVSAEDITLVKRAYHKEWREKNKDKVRESNKKYWAKKAAEFKEKMQNKKRCVFHPTKSRYTSY